MYVYITSNYVLIQSRISKIHHSFRGESANFVAKPQNLLEVGPSKRGKAVLQVTCSRQENGFQGEMREGLRGASQKWSYVKRHS